MNELMAFFRGMNAPKWDKQIFVVLECGCAFEPHGRASEDWEWYWKLTLPLIPYYWLSTEGWKRGKCEKPMSFLLQTAEGAIEAARDFLANSDAIEMLRRR